MTYLILLPLILALFVGSPIRPADGSTHGRVLASFKRRLVTTRMRRRVKNCPVSVLYSTAVDRAVSVLYSTAVDRAVSVL